MLRLVVFNKHLIPSTQHTPNSCSEGYSDESHDNNASNNKNKPCLQHSELKLDTAIQQKLTCTWCNLHRGHCNVKLLLNTYCQV